MKSTTTTVIYSQIIGTITMILFKTWDTNLCITAWPFVHWSPFVSCFVCNKPKVKFMHSCNHTEHFRKWLHYLTRSKHDCTCDSCILSRSTSVPVTNKGRSAFPSANNYQGQLQTPQAVSVLRLRTSCFSNQRGHFAFLEGRNSSGMWRLFFLRISLALC
jgi:hypothetical protein